MASGGYLYRKLRTNNPSHNKTNGMLYKFSSRPCDFRGYRCSHPCVENYSYCIRHILEDDNAPFQQCSYSYSYTLKRCPNATLKTEYGESFCPDHLTKVQRVRHRSSKTQPQISTEKLLSSLSHYAHVPDKPGPSSGSKAADQLKEELNPFTDIDADAINNSLCTILDYCSESDSDVDTAVIARTVRCHDEESSDGEGIDSAGEDVLKFASVLTADEVLTRAKEKSLRLKTLYTEQLKRLKYVLQESRRDYIMAIQQEKERLGSIAEQSTSSARDLKFAEKIKAYNHYRKALGEEAILRKKMKDKGKGIALDAQIIRPGGFKCVFTEGGVKCNVRTLPNSKFCPKHILSDPFQVLFRPCGFATEDSTCREPLPGMEPCIYHMDMIPTHITYNTALSSEEDEEIKEDPQPVKEELGEAKMDGAVGSSTCHEELELGEVKLENDQHDFSRLEIVDAEAFGFEEEIVVCDEPMEIL